jgi:predicted lactoylglutathione lyase
MSRMIFVNLPVADVARSRAFFTALGFSINEQFSDDKAICVVIDDNIFAMLLHRDYFQTFTPKAVADAGQATEVLVALSTESRAAVDAMVEAGVHAGGSEPRPAQDHGWMYQRALEDLDGHIWEIAWMEPQTAAS